MKSEILVSNFSNLKILQEFREFFRVFLLVRPSPGLASHPAYLSPHFGKIMPFQGIISLTHLIICQAFIGML
jgi:hypothetical protein